jgi:hypothetical protein
MFEGLVSSVSPQQAAEPGTFRAVEWPDLVAKFAAARDLRELFAADARRSLASFAPDAAQALAGCAQAERDVNPEALSHGKFHGPTEVSAANDARDGDREMT